MKIKRGFLFFIFSLIYFIKIPSVFAESYDFIGFPTSPEGTNSWYVSNPMGGNYLLGDKWLIGHLGDDFVAKEGTPLYAVSNSVIYLKKDWPKCSYVEDVCNIDTSGQEKCTVKKVYNHGWGPVVVLKHDISPNKFNTEGVFLKGSEVEQNPSVVYSHYGHLDSVAGLAEGQQVTKGQKIAEVGKVCGYWPHLHFEIKDTFAMQNELHDGVGIGYSKTDGVVPHHYSPSKFIELNKNLVLAEEKPEPEQDQKPKSNFFSFLKNPLDIFSVLLTKKDEGIKGEKVNEQQAIKQQAKEQQAIKQQTTQTNYNTQILNPSEKFTALPGQELKIKISAKNTGTTTWLQKNVSINVVGGEAANAKFKHPSWMSNLRTTRLDQTAVTSGETGTFSFSITAPQTLGNYTFKSFLVLQNGVNFTSIGTGIYSATLTIVEKFEEEEPVEKQAEEIAPQNSFKDILGETLQKGKETTQKVVDTIIDSVKNIPNLFNFSSRSGGSPNSPENTTTSTTTTSTTTTSTTTDSTTTTSTTTDSGTTSTTTTVTADNGEYWISMLTPESSPFTTNATNTLISGTKSEDVTEMYLNNVLIDSSTFTTTTWHYLAELHEGSNSFEFFTHDQDGNVTSTITLEIIHDTTAPTIPTLILTQETFASPTLSISWSSADATDTTYYDIQFKESTADDWTSLFESTSTTQTSIEVERYLSYEARARAIDTLGNISDWSEPVSLTIDWPKTIVLNEINWIGVGSFSTQCKNPEWIELYNTTDTPIDLSGWSLRVDSKNTTFSIPLSNSTVVLNTIDPHGYYLIENIDKVISNFKANALFPLGKKLEDSGAKLTILDASGETIDMTDQKSAWFGGGLVGDKYLPMERIDVTQPGNNASNWRNSDYRIYSIKSDCRNPVYGSPRLPGDTNHYLPSNITQVYDFGADKTLTLSSAQSPYIFDLEVEIPPDYTLQIEPGVVLLASTKDAGFNVEGTLELLGSDENPILITSLTDTIHGDWCSDTYLSTFCVGIATPGTWEKIRIMPGGTLTMHHTKLYYAGAKYKYNNTCSTCVVSQAIRNEGGTVSISGATIADSYSPAYNNSSDAFVYTSGGTLTITNSHFSQGCRALTAQEGALVSVDESNFSQFSCEYPAILKSIYPISWSGNILQNNLSNAVYIPALTIDQDITIESGASLAFSGLEIPQDHTLTAEPGAQILLEKNALIRAYGNIDFQGTADNPVQIMQGADGGYGGFFVQGGTVQLSHVLFNGGGYFPNQSSYPMQHTESAVLWFNSAQVTMNDIHISHARRPGGTIYATDSTLSILNSTFGWDEPYDNKLATWFDNGITVRNSILHIDNVNFKKMDIALSIYDGSTFTYENFGPQNFIDPYHTQYKNWQPADLFDFDLFGVEEEVVEGVVEDVVEEVVEDVVEEVVEDVVEEQGDVEEIVENE